MKKISKFLISLLVFSFLMLPVISFAQTTSKFPTITASVSEITSNSAKITTTIEKFDVSLFPIKLTLVWGKVGGTPQFTALDTENLKVSDIPHTITTVLDNLETNTTNADNYVYRIVQTGSNIPYTDIHSFKTLASSTSTTSVTANIQTEPDVTSNTATLYATLHTTSEINTDDTYFFQYVNDADYKTSGFNSENKIGSVQVTNSITNSTSEGVFSANAYITGLDPNTKYHYRLQINEDNELTFSNEATFTTPVVFVPIVDQNLTTPTTNPTTNTSTTTNTDTTQLIPCGTTANSTLCEGAGGWDNLMKLINNIVSFVLFKLAMPIAAIMFAYAGFELLTAGGEVSKMTKAKKIFMNVALGLIFAAAAWLIVNTLLTILGYTGKW